MGDPYRALSEDEICKYQRRMNGIKHDEGKDRWDLLPLAEIQEVVKVLTFGARKYGAHKWRTVENPQDRYFAAAMRHIAAHQLGETTDQESGLDHLAHAICCLLFMMAGEER